MDQGDRGTDPDSAADSCPTTSQCQPETSFEAAWSPFAPSKTAKLTGMRAGEPNCASLSSAVLRSLTRTTRHSPLAHAANARVSWLPEGCGVIDPAAVALASSTACSGVRSASGSLPSAWA